MFVVLLLIALVLVGVVLYLPYASGLATYEIDRSSKEKRKKEELAAAKKTDVYDQFGYVPPDEVTSNEATTSGSSLKARASALKEKIHVTPDDIPLKMKLSTPDGSSSLRRRGKEKLDLDTDPNNYDYDIDELIEEENEIALNEQQKEFYKNEVIGKEKEEMV
ncbi:uncharacterized protein RJT20DRAFT_15724 [Scheffersomyces xylosifermentans]|uniref:uncharacterized protein n=1 Tax=Scheffersomyces xylosifermentans TaxID=1304137 RepID=UPI00315C645F